VNTKKTNKEKPVTDDADANEDSGKPNPLYIYDETEYERLKAALAAGRPLSAADIERLAFTLDDRCVMHCAEDDDLESASEEIALLFACADPLPDSALVREMLYSSALYYIDEAGVQEDFSAVENRCLTKLRIMLETDRENKSLARVCANGLVLTIGNYLNCDEPSTREARMLERELGKLAGRYAADPVMPAMQAWARRLFVRESLHQQDFPQAREQLREFAEFLERNPDNALVACEYANVCYSLFLERFKTDDAVRAEMLDELERLLRTYTEAYAAYGDTEPDYEFPGYEPTRLHSFFLNALSDAAVCEAEKDNLEGTLALEARLNALPCPSCAEKSHKFIRRQLHSNIAALYGGAKEYAKAEERVDKLRDMARPRPKDEYGDADESVPALSDALYNLLTDYVNDDPLRHRERTQSILGELESLAARTDGAREHTRYVWALYNLTWQLEACGVPHMPVWDRLYAYMMAHNIEEKDAELVASKEAEMTGERKDAADARLHYERAKAIARHPAYARVRTMPICLSSAAFNFLVAASDAGDLRQAEKTVFADLTALAEEHAGREEIEQAIVLRLTKGGLNLVTDCGNAGDIASAERIYSETARFASRFAQDAEIANRWVSAAFNLCVDLNNAKPKAAFFSRPKHTGNAARIREIYEGVKDARPDGDAAARLEKLRRMAQG
jgi:hypothetical protein